MKISVCFACCGQIIYAQLDTFEWRGKNLGKIQEVALRTDGSGLGADWQLDYVTGGVCDACSALVLCSGN